MSDLLLVRLVSADPTAWQFWPLLEGRIRAALPTLEPDAPPEAVIRKLRELWVTKPHLIGAWLAPRKDTHAIAAHMVAWVDTYWDELCINVYQLVGDPGAGAMALRDPMLAELDQWRTYLNAGYARAGDARRIDLVRFYAEKPAAYIRWFQSAVEVRKGGTICTFRLSQVALPSPVEEG